MYCWQQQQHQYEQFINAFLSLKAQFDPGLRCSYLNTKGDYHSPPARGTMETIPPSGHVIPPKGCLMLPEGRCRPNVDVVQRRDKAAEGRIRLHIVESKMTSLRISQFLIFGPTIGLPESCIFWGTN